MTSSTAPATMDGAPVQTRIHPTAVVDPKAELGAGVDIGPYADRPWHPHWSPCGD